MDTGSLGSNTLTLFVAILDTKGSTFIERSMNYIAALDAKMSRIGKNSDEWKRLLREKGQVEGFIRHDRYGVSHASSHIAVAA